MGGLAIISSGLIFLQLLIVQSASEYTNYSIKDNLCPRGYWLANVKKNEHTGAQTFEIKDMDSKADVCRYCEDVSCFIFKHPKRSTKKVGDVFEIEEDVHTMEYSMTCKKHENLPHPSVIVEFLDCVKIGYEDMFHLLLYLPEHSTLTQPIEFFDPGFLDWIVDSKKRLFSLELGFPMRHLPQLFVNNYTPILANTTQICFDASQMAKLEPKFEDVSTPNKSDINRLYVFRLDGLQRDRPPPLAEDLPDCPNNQIDDKECLIEFNNLRPALKFVEKKQLTDRLRINETLFQSIYYKMNSYDSYYYRLSSMLLLLLVIVFTLGSILIFCINNRDKFHFCRRKKKKLDSDFLNDPIEEMNRMMYPRPDMQYNGMMNNQMMAGNPRMMPGNYNRQPAY